MGPGADVGGSQRTPASLAGVCTLKATPGRIPSASEFEPAAPSLAMSLMTSFGPFARTTAGLALAYRVLARADMRDPWDVPFDASAGRGAAARRFVCLDDVAADWPDLEPLLGAECRRWLEDAFTARPPLMANAPLVLAPAMTVPAPRWASISPGRTRWRVAVVPVGLADGLPVAVQLIGPLAASRMRPAS